jgi:hypothetical protein
MVKFNIIAPIKSPAKLNAASEIRSSREKSRTAETSEYHAKNGHYIYVCH